MYYTPLYPVLQVGIMGYKIFLLGLFIPRFYCLVQFLDLNIQIKYGGRIDTPLNPIRKFYFFAWKPFINRFYIFREQAILQTLRLQLA